MPSLKGNVSWAFAGNAVYSFSLWLVLAMMAHFYGAEKVGFYSIGLAIVGPVFSFFNLNLRAYQSTDQNYDFDVGFYVSFRFFTSVIAFLVLQILCVFLDYSKEVILCIEIVCFVKLFEAFSDVLHGESQRKEELDFVGRSLIYRGVFSVVLFGVVSWVFDSFYITLLSILFSYMLVFVFHDLSFYWKVICLNINFKGFVGVFYSVLPLGFVLLVNALAVNVPRYFIENEYGYEVLGVYAAISYFIVAGAIFMNAVGQSLLPRMTKLSNDYYSLIKVLKKFFMMAIIIGLIGVFVAFVVGEYIVVVFYGNDFIQYGYFLNYIMMVALVMYLSNVVGTTLTSLRFFGYQSIVSIVFLVFVIVFSYSFIPKYGLDGAALALLLSYFMKFVFSGFILFVKLNDIKSREAS